MKKYLLIVYAVLTFIEVTAQVDTVQHIIEGRTNSIEQQQKPYVILISGDGFRYDFAEKYNATNLLAFAKQGVKATSMIPSYPSLTFPNHYTLVTGLFPSHHGLVNNGFYDAKRNESYSMSNKTQVEDGSWYNGQPLWVVAEKQKMVTASFYWVGSEVNIDNTYPTYYYRYNEKIPIEKRVQVVKDWLELPPETRPHLITFYFPEVDYNGHKFGPESMKTKQAVQKLDSSVALLVDAVKTTGLPVNFIFVSDHGMKAIDTINRVHLTSKFDTTRFIKSLSSNLIELYAKNKKDILPAYNLLKKNQWHYTAYLKSNVPENLHYGAKDDRYNRIGDIILITDAPYVFYSRSKKIDVGVHGYPPLKVKEMQATFYAWGPAFKRRVTIPSFENVNVYPMVAEILGLKITNKIDGKRNVLHSILSPSK